MRKLLRQSAIFAALAAAVLVMPMAASSAFGGQAAGAQLLGSDLPLHPDTYAQAKALLDSASGKPAVSASGGGSGSTTPHDPIANPSWQGVDENDLAPPDTTGAIGPNSYIEMINLQMAIYDRNGVKLGAKPLEVLTGSAHFDLSDPQVIWDPDTNRFYYEVLDVTNDTIFWGFSKTDSPRVLPTDFCNYNADFGYGGDLPDYPKLGQTTDFLMIGVNVFTAGAVYADSEVDTISKSVGKHAVSTCPAKSTFKLTRGHALLNADASPTSTPEPAVQTDPSGTGWIVGSADVSNPGSSAAFLTVFKVTKNADGSPNIQNPGTAVPVPSYSMPASATQRNSGTKLDTLDGRLIHAVSGKDPSRGGALAIWTSHTVDSGFIFTNGDRPSDVRWYEIDPLHATTFQRGIVSYAQSGPPDASTACTPCTGTDKYVFNGAISPDRKVNGTNQAFGNAMVLGFTTSSLFDFPAIQMVSKISDNPQSAAVLVQQSLGADQGFDCFENPNVPGTCRWGDYAGATPDPAASPSLPNGRVWLTNEWTSPIVDPLNATWLTWNWQATP